MTNRNPVANLLLTVDDIYRHPARLETDSADFPRKIMIILLGKGKPF